MDRQRHRWIFNGINVIAIALMLYIANRFTSGTPRQVSYSEFLVELRAGKLTDVQITERELIGVLKSDSSHPKPTQELTIKATRLPGQRALADSSLSRLRATCWDVFWPSKF